jgi:hypothetical protein
MSSSWVGRLEIIRNVVNSAFGSDSKLKAWRDSGFPMPAPLTVKHAVLARHAVPNALWFETGTYLGQTTARLGADGCQVISVEADSHLFNNARKNLAHLQNVRILKGNSAEILASELRNIQGPTNFWLDAHYSGPGTFRGIGESPIVDELAAIENSVERLTPFVVFIDDFRCFGDASGEYPPKSFLVSWASKLGLAWTVEHDVFIASSRTHLNA